MGKQREPSPLLPIYFSFPVQLQPRGRQACHEEELFLHVPNLFFLINGLEI